MSGLAQEFDTVSVQLRSVTTDNLSSMIRRTGLVIGVVFLFACQPVMAQALLQTLDTPEAQESTFYGEALAQIGDVNGDSVPDLAVGAPGQSVGETESQGRVYIYSGSDRSLITILDTPIPQNEGWFGGVISGMGDLNGDLVPDIAISAIFQDVEDNEDQGQVYVLSVTDGVSIHTLDNPIHQEFSNFGSSLAELGDINDDGISDIVVGARSQMLDEEKELQGQAFVFSGADGALIRTLDDPQPQAFALFGTSVAGLGDVNGDTVADMAVGSLYHVIDGEGGKVFVFSGADGTLIHTLEDPSQEIAALFGFTLSPMFDLNGDFITDIAISAPGQIVNGNPNQGQVLVYSGADGSLLHTLNNPIPQIDAAFGASLAQVKDLNGDSLPEIAVGAPFQNVGAIFEQEHVEQGQIFVFSGEDGTLLQTINHPFPQSAANFGLAIVSVDSINDINTSPVIAASAPEQIVGVNEGQGQTYIISLVED